MKNYNGFTLIEVMIALMVVALALLAVQMMQFRSVGDNATSGGISAKSMLASARIENIMNLPYKDSALTDDDGDGTGQDLNFDGIDDQDDGNVNTVTATEQFGLRHSECCAGGVDPRGVAVPGCVQVADHCAPNVNGDYDIYWNVAIDVPVKNNKTINIIVVNTKDKQTRLTTRPEMLNRAEYKYVKDDTI